VKGKVRSFFKVSVDDLKRAESSQKKKKRGERGMPHSIKSTAKRTESLDFPFVGFQKERNGGAIIYRLSLNIERVAKERRRILKKEEE